MTPILHLLHSFSAIAAGFLVASVWEGLVVAVCVAILLRLLPGLTAAVRSAIWAVVLLLVMFFPGLSLLAHGSSASVSAHAGLYHASETWSLVLLGVWFVFSLLRVSQLIGSAIRLQSLARRAVVVEPNEPIAAILRGSSRRVELCVSSEVDRPSVAGFFRPRILLSPELHATLSESELEQVILHEMEHLRRYDDWMNLLQKLSLALVPLHPVLPWLDRQMCLERELACDDYVLRQTRGRKAYASCLARVAEASIVRRGFSLALGALGNRVRSRERTSELANRVHRILRAPEKRMSRGRVWLATSVLLAGVFAGTAVLARSPELVSFAPVAQPLAAFQASAREIAAPHFEAASFRQSGAFPAYAAHQTLVKAVMPEREPSVMRTSAMRNLVAHKSTHRMRRPATRSIEQREIATPRPYVTLIAWRPVTTPAFSTMSISEYPQDMQYPQDPQFLYAAVPMRDGWLIIQL